VVGGTSGIGHGIALALANRGDVEVTIAGRSETRGNDIVERELSRVSPQHNHAFAAVDAFDLKSVKELAAKHQGRTELLVMTQGMATLQGYTPTGSGLDQKLQLHYFSRIYLAQLLAPHMPKGSRIITVLSAGVHGKYRHFQDDFELERNYSIKNAADAAGWYTDAGFEALAEKHPHLVVAHAAPGFVNTNWGTEMPTVVRGIIRPLQSLFGKSQEECGETLTTAWMNLETPGYYLIDPKGELISNGIKHTPEERDIIWNKTMLLLPDV
jgi:NAD(P)-dependent dehydrogenase (short-subunit alcohol dehydrogenase family)